MKRNLLVTLADQNFLDQAKQLFSSAYWNAGWDGDYMLLAHGMQESQLDWFRRKQILVKKVEASSVEDYSAETLNYPAIVTSKLALFSEEFKCWNNVVFIDADCIVRYSLDALTKTTGFAAARDWLDTAIIKYQIRKPDGMDELEYFRKFNGYSPTATAFNTGVFAFNTSIINDDIEIRLKQMSWKFKNVGLFPEQLWMNLYFYKRWTMLPMEYNLFASYLHTKRGLPKKYVDGVVLHFPRFANEQGLRCWEYGNAFFDEWKKNLERADAIDLEHIPKSNRKWPRLKHLLLRRWLLRIALSRDYINFFRSKMSVRSRMRQMTSTLTTGKRCPLH